jgi:hypothetical protein
MAKALRDWVAEPENAAMFLRNELKDQVHSWQVMERNIRYVERDLQAKRDEAAAKKTEILALGVELEARTPATPRP